MLKISSLAQVEKNESTIEAAKRELEEESGLIAELSDLQKERLQDYGCLGSVISKIYFNLLEETKKI